MTKLKTVLSALLVVQLALLIGLFVSGNKDADFDQEQALVAVDINTVDRLLIEGGEGAPLSLLKDGEQWRLPDYGNLLVDSAKVDEVLEKVEKTKTGWPIAQSSASRERFEVSDDKFQRKLTLFKNEEPTSTFYLGSSPGYRSVHLRRAGEDEIYSVKLASHDFSTENVDWFDKGVLAVKNITRMDFSDFSLSKTENQWQLADGSADDNDSQTLNQASVEALADLFSGFSAQEYAPDVELKDAASVKVAGESGDYEFAFAVINDNYYVRRDDIAKVFRITEYDYDKLQEVKLANLVEESSSEEQAELDTGSSDASSDGLSSEVSDAVESVPSNQRSEP